jgi:hypothetical protein
VFKGNIVYLKEGKIEQTYLGDIFILKKTVHLLFKAAVDEGAFGNILHPTTDSSGNAKLELRMD